MKNKLFLLAATLGLGLAANAQCSFSTSNTICSGTSVSGGSWSSSNNAIATVGTDGAIYAVSAGAVTITYTTSLGYITMPLTVNPSPNAGSISGGSTVCAGADLALSNAAPGGSWSSSNTSVATVNGSGLVHGVAGGTATISYTVTNSCGTAYVTAPVTVNTVPSVDAITGPDAFCKGDMPVDFDCATTGGSWSMTSTNRLTISSVGTVSAGWNATPEVNDVTLYYAVTNGCGTTTVNKNIRAKGYASYSGTGYICVGGSITITGSPSGGTWSYSSGEPGTYFSASGAVPGNVITGLVANGSTSANVYYAAPDNSNYCSYPLADRPMFIGSPSLAFSGPSTVAAGSSITLTASGGYPGNWFSSATAIATVSTTSTASSQSIHGVASGSATITFAGGTRCPVTITKDITVSSGARGTAATGTTAVDMATAPQREISIKPNPSTGRFTVSLPAGNEPSTIIVTNAAGKVVATRVSAKDQEDFDLGNVARGIYIVTVDNGGKKYKQKVQVD